MAKKKSGNFIEPKDWKEFQHYTKRSPPWIKLHKKLLDNYDFHCLPDASRALAPMLWLLASEFDDGKITATYDAIAFRLHMTQQDFVKALNPLVEAEFFSAASETLAERKQSAIPETEREAEIEVEAKTELSTSSTPPKGKSKALKLTAEPPSKPAPKSRATRLDILTAISDKNREDAKQAGLNEAETLTAWVDFRNYYSAASGASGLSHNWDAVWHNAAMRYAAKLGKTPQFNDISAPPKIPERTPFEWRKFMRVFVQTDNWLSSWGPKPDQPGCVVPKEVLREFKLGEFADADEA